MPLSLPLTTLNPLVFRGVDLIIVGLPDSGSFTGFYDM